MHGGEGLPKPSGKLFQNPVMALMLFGRAVDAIAAPFRWEGEIRLQRGASVSVPPTAGQDVNVLPESGR